MKIVVVGASSGLGRCIGVDRGQRGDQVALLARRLERVTAAAEEAGPGNVGIACDVTDESSCQAAITEAADRLGGIDALVYSTGVGPLQPIDQLTADTWRHALNTNVVGAAIATTAALPFLQKSGGRALYLSSVSASAGRPWPGFGAYTVSKVALERLIEAFRVEQPGIRFTRVVVGDCAGGEGEGGTEFPANWDWDYAAQVMEVWQQRGYMATSLMEVAELVEGVDFVLRTGAAVPNIALTPLPG